MTTGIMLIKPTGKFRIKENTEKVILENMCHVTLIGTNAEIEYRNVKQILFPTAKQIVIVTVNSKDCVTVLFSEEIAGTLLDEDNTVTVLTPPNQEWGNITGFHLG